MRLIFVLCTLLLAAPAYAAGSCERSATIMTATDCGFCRATVSYFRQHGIPFDEISVGSLRNIGAYGLTAVPLIRFPSGSILGFNREEINLHFCVR